MKNCFYTGIIAFVLGFSFSFLFIDDDSVTCQSNFKYTSSELDCFSSDTERLKELESSIFSHVQKMKKDEPSILRTSVFYRNLKTKRWFGVNERELFTPGSLLKIPLAIAYHKYREINPDVFEESLVFKELPGGVSDNVSQHIQPLDMLVPGKSYVVDDLLARLLIYSDNDAIRPLFEAINPVFYDKVLKDFDIRLPKDVGIERDFVTVKTYGALFRSLYNASYLNREESENLLATMSQTVFKDGLVAGIPKGVQVAHKFGERSYQNSTSSQSTLEFHDCGIVYHEVSPYILCVMTEGTNFEKQKEMIKTISKQVYDSH